MFPIPISPPNQLTLLRIILTPVFVYFLFSPNPVDKQIALGIFIVAAITDWYDGYVARRWGYITRWGKFLDPLADKVLTSAAFVSFVIIGYASAWMVGVIVIRDFLITILRTYAEYKNKPINTSHFAKTKTFAQLIVIYLFLIRYIVLADENLTAQLAGVFDVVATPSIMSFMMIIVTLMTAGTGIYYFVVNWNILKELFSVSTHGTDTERSTD
ncbi:MAG: CDP-diacylglycerol--glycerol-3-phosphate 3-phosphatidyltransferase [Ignavibacteriales bacterium]|nr:CDP-diacylglycerol--glycerol-3-phosphate 3-phosphatidyltransferase [Ignavibacteriales bacterium]